MRIGTWNLAGRWTDEHRDFLLALDCDVLLLTEVNDRVDLPGHAIHRGAAEMAAKRRWAAVASHSPLEALPDPHAASAAAEIGGAVFCSSILPWRSCGDRWPGANTHERTTIAVDDIRSSLDHSLLVWGGDWNHALSGREYAGSAAGRIDILSTAAALGLQIPTAALPHAIDGLLAIDHIAVPANWTLSGAERIPAVGTAGRRLSDHDAYIVDAAR